MQGESPGEWCANAWWKGVSADREDGMRCDATVSSWRNAASSTSNIAQEQVIELGHQQRGAEVVDLPQRAHHAGRACLHKGGRWADALTRVAFDVVEPGLASGEHAQARAAEAALVLQQPPDGERLLLTHDEARSGTSF